MTANDVVLLTDMLERFKDQTLPVVNDSDHDTYFTAKQYLRHLNPTHDDLMSGLVDGTQDGGIDAIYVYVNGFCIRDDAPLASLGRNAQLDLVLLQVKNSKVSGRRLSTNLL